MYDLETHETFVSRDVRFVEHIFPFATPTTDSSVLSPLVSYSDYELLSASDDRGSVSNAPTTTTPQPTHNNFVDVGSQSIIGAAQPGSSPTIQQHVPSVEQVRDVPSIATPSSSPDKVVVPSSTSTLLDNTTAPTSPCRESSDNEASFGFSRRERRPPPYLSDYICHIVRTTPPISSSPSSTGSSGIPYPIANFVTYDGFSSSHRKYVASVTTSIEPRSFKQAVQHERWRIAMTQEIQALEKNRTWDFVARAGNDASRARV